MVRRFYSDVAQDDVLGPMFNDVAKVDWSEHLPKLTAFWCRLLFGVPGYAGNPLRAHQLIHAKRAFKPQHFERWLELFHDAVDLGWTGPKAEKAKAFAIRVARAHAQRLDRTKSAEPGMPVTIRAPNAESVA
jgi:hemoglobin